jgi:hypothetical protein
MGCSNGLRPASIYSLLPRIGLGMFVQVPQGSLSIFTEEVLAEQLDLPEAGQGCLYLFLMPTPPRYRLIAPVD